LSLGEKDKSYDQNGGYKTSALQYSIAFLQNSHSVFYVVSHHIPMIWKFHKVHHSDPDLDVTSGFRFHPIEIILSLVLKSLAIVLLGVHPMGVVVFEVLLNAGSLFNHSNISVHKNLDNILRRIIVTPTFHLVHHSTKPSETNSNFGFTISIWDQLFKTYKPLEDLKIGLNEYPEPNQLTIQKLLMIPFEPSETKESKNEI